MATTNATTLRGLDSRVRELAALPLTYDPARLVGFRVRVARLSNDSSPNHGRQSVVVEAKMQNQLGPDGHESEWDDWTPVIGRLANAPLWATGYVPDSRGAAERWAEEARRWLSDRGWPLA